MKCSKCGYNGNDGWNVRTVGQTERGDSIEAWFCPECGEEICTEGIDCPPDSFGQYRDEPGGFTRNIYDER
jgi:predicted RNA-binding Zn-ribbon protein involved in translation (DUF1610 family)